MKRVRVALDANIPERLVELLRTGFGDQGYEFLWEPNFAPADAADEFWADVFSRFGGEIVITGDKNIAKRPHQMLAFRDAGLKSFFLGSRWGTTKLRFKAAHMLFWWPHIARRARICKPGEAFWVPIVLKDKEFKEVVFPRAGAAKKAAKPRRRKQSDG